MRRFSALLAVLVVLLVPSLAGAQRASVSVWQGQTVGDTLHPFAPGAPMTARIAKDSVVLSAQSRTGAPLTVAYARRATDAMRTVLVDGTGRPVAEMVHFIDRGRDAKVHVTTVLRTTGSASTIKRTIATFPHI